MLPLCLLLLAEILMSENVHTWEVQRDFTSAVAEKMPAQDYAYAATPEEMGFGRMMVHLGNALGYNFEKLSGEKARLITDPPYDKPAVIKFIRESFDYVIHVLPKIPAGRLDATYDLNWEGRKQATGREIILGMLVHTAHHRAQLEVYLRLKGIEPPVYTF